MELHYKYIEHIKDDQTKLKKRYGMAKHHQKPTEMERKQAKMTCQSMKHVKLV